VNNYEGILMMRNEHEIQKAIRTKMWMPTMIVLMVALTKLSYYSCCKTSNY